MTAKEIFLEMLKPDAKPERQLILLAIAILLVKNAIDLEVGSVYTEMRRQKRTLLAIPLNKQMRRIAITILRKVLSYSPAKHNV